MACNCIFFSFKNTALICVFFLFFKDSAHAYTDTYLHLFPLFWEILCMRTMWHLSGSFFNLFLVRYCACAQCDTYLRLFFTLLGYWACAQCDTYLCLFSLFLGDTAHAHNVTLIFLFFSLFGRYCSCAHCDTSSKKVSILSLSISDAGKLLIWKLLSLPKKIRKDGGDILSVGFLCTRKHIFACDAT